MVASVKPSQRQVQDLTGIVPDAVSLATEPLSARKNGCQTLGFWLLWEKVTGSIFRGMPLTGVRNPGQAQVLDAESATLLA